jgi:hypothetical protein
MAIPVPRPSLAVAMRAYLPLPSTRRCRSAVRDDHRHRWIPEPGHLGGDRLGNLRLALGELAPDPLSGRRKPPDRLPRLLSGTRDLADAESWLELVGDIGRRAVATLEGPRRRREAPAAVLIERFGAREVAAARPTARSAAVPFAATRRVSGGIWLWDWGGWQAASSFVGPHGGSPSVVGSREDLAACRAISRPPASA